MSTYHYYEGITTYQGQCSGRPLILNDNNRQRKTKQATLRELTTLINAGRPSNVSYRTLQRN